MRAHLIQLDIVWEDPDANRSKVEALLSGTDIRPGDFLLLPEMFDTGFSLNVETTADEREETLAWLRSIAMRTETFVQGGRTKRVGPSGVNMMSAFDPGGTQLCEFAKIHPFSFGRESERFEGGTEVMTWSWGQLSVCPAVCYDLRFPELFRMGLLQGAQVIALGANWPDTRQSHWRALAIARAIENQAFMLAVNRTGADPHLNYVGGSIAVDPHGEVLGELDTHEAVLSVEIDPNVVIDWRKTFPAHRDIRLMSLPRC